MGMPIVIFSIPRSQNRPSPTGVKASLSTPHRTVLEKFPPIKGTYLTPSIPLTISDYRRRLMQ